MLFGRVHATALVLLAGVAAAVASSPGAEAVPATPAVRLRNGVEMPLVACGTGGWTNTTAEQGVTAALRAGFRSIDTAHDYGDLGGVARGMAAAGVPRSSVFLTTKIPGCGETVDHPLLPPCYGNSVAMAQADIEQLGGQVDLLLIHFPPLLGCGGAACTKIQQQWTAVEQLYRHNFTRAIGVSNFCEACLKCVLVNATVPPMVNQVQYHVGMGPDPAGLVTYCNKTGIVLEAYSPLAGGRLLKANASFPHGAELAAKYHWASAAQVGLAYIAQRGLPVVTKSSDPRYLAEDLDLFGPSHAIDQADRAQIDALTQPNCEMEAPGGCCHAA